MHSLQIHTHARGLAVASLFAICLPGAAPGRAGAAPLPGQAVTPAHLPEPGDVGVFFDAGGMYYRRGNTVPFVPFDVFVVAFAPPGGMEAYELGLTLPPGGIVSSGRVLPPGATDFGAGDDNWIVGTGGVCQGVAGTFSLVTYRGLLFLSAVANDATICLSGAQPSSFANGAPGYLVCNSPGELRNFGAAYPGCAILNPTGGDCIGHVAELTLALGHQTTAPGAPASLAVTSSAIFHDPCVPKDLPTPIGVTRIEMDLVWDASVATFVGPRFPDDGQGAPTIVVTPGAGTATAVVTRLDPPLYFVVNSPAQPLWLDFLGGPQAGQTSVDITRLEVDTWVGTVPLATQSGSITTQGVPTEQRSFGSLKATWGSED